ncbi:MAG: hypothetical protein ACI9JR_002165 [Gammaproteobacteria bacterium]|jgi:hypothetical protein
MSDNLMTDEELDTHFRELVDLFIDQGNELAKKSNSENVSLALLHAASRFNAFVVSSHAETVVQYEKDIVGAKSYFLSEYETMLDENFEDYKAVYVNRPVDANAN